MRLLLILIFVSEKMFFRNVHTLNGDISVFTFTNNFVYKDLKYIAEPSLGIPIDGCKFPFGSSCSGPHKYSDSKQNCQNLWVLLVFSQNRWMQLHLLIHPNYDAGIQS